MNRKGMIEIGFILTLTLITSLTTLGFYKTHKNGVLKNNGKKIWCKMQNKGEAFCNEQYAFTPEPYHWEKETRTYEVPVYVPVGE